MAMRIAVSPAHKLSSVKKFGSSMRTGILLCRKSRRPRRRRSASSSFGRKGSMATSFVAYSLQPGLALHLLRLEVGKHGFAANGSLAERHQCPAPRWKVDIHARSKPDQPDALADADVVALLHEGDDPTGDQPGDLDHGDTAASRGCDDHGAALVELARLVGRGVDETALHVDRAGNASRHRCAIDVHIKNRKKDRDPQALVIAEPEFTGRLHPLDGADLAVAGGNDEAVTQRCHAWRIAKEVGDPRRRQCSKPAQRRPQQKAHQGHGGGEGKELVAVGVDRRDLIGDGLKQAVALGHAASVLAGPALAREFGLLPRRPQGGGQARHSTGMATNRNPPLPLSSRSSTALRPAFVTLSMPLVMSSMELTAS